MFHRMTERNYIVDHKGLFFSHSDIVRTDRIENDLILRIEARKFPDEIYFNGQRMTLIPLREEFTGPSPRP